MKIKHLIILLLLAAPLVSSAQFVSEVLDLPTDPTLLQPTRYSVVRTIDDNNTVSYANDQVMQEFMITEHTPYFSTSIMPFTCHHISIHPRVLKVWDIRVVDDYVYFCGEYINNTAFIGYFQFSGSPLALPTTMELMEVPDAQVLWRMAAYKNTGGIPKVVAVGIGAANPTYDRVVVEMDDIHNAGTYSYVLLPREEMSDVALVGSETVVVGQSHLTGTLCLRKSHCDMVLSSQFDTRYHYVPPTGENYTMLTAVSTYDNMLAAAYFHTDLTPLRYYTRIRHFSIPTMQMVNSHEISCSNKPYIHEMAYVRQLKAAMLLQDIPFPLGDSTYESVFTPIFPARTTGYSADARFFPRSTFWSLDLVRDRHIVSTGEDVMLLDNPTVALPPSNCVKEDKETVNVIDNCTLLETTMPLSVYSGSVTRVTHNVSASIYPNAPQNCTNP